MNSASQWSETFFVFALNPCRVLDNAIRQAKIKTNAIAGEQTYLSHPPHMTLYVSAFDSIAMVADRCERLIALWQPPKLEIKGWHHFQGDVLTGNQTLVCEIAEESKAVLRDYQRQLIEAISNLRCIEPSSNRYRPYFGTLSQERQAAVEQVGFPFIGSDWIPHLTIASIESSQWDHVWRALKTEPPLGNFECPTFTIYQLQNDYPETYRKIGLG